MIQATEVTDRLSESGQAAWIVTGIKWLISIAVSLWVAADTDIKILAILAIVDVVFSLFNPVVRLGQRIRQVCLMFLIVGTVHLVYAVAHTQAGLNLGFDLSAMVSCFYCLGEGVAILKSADSLGIRLPPVLLDVISKAEGLTGSDKREIIALRLKQDQEETTLHLEISPKNDGKKIVEP